MKIFVAGPFTSRQNLVFLIFCILAFAGLVIGLHFLVPVLDRQSGKMTERRQAIEEQIRENYLRASCEAASAPDPACAKYLASKISQKYK